MRRFILVALIAAACSKSEETKSEAPFVARFELPASGVPDVLAVPFPSDVWRAADGTIALPENGLEQVIPNAKGVTFVREALAQTRGFGVYAGSVFLLEGKAPDAALLPKGEAAGCGQKESPVIFFDLDANNALDCQAGWNDDSVFGQDETKPALVVRTARGVVVPEGHRVAVLLTNALRAKDGTPLSASSSFAAMRDSQRGDATRKLYGDAIDSVTTALSIDRARVVDAAVYTTGKLTEDVRAARETMRAMPAPALKWNAADVAPVTPARFTNVTPLPEGWTASLDALFGTPNKLPSGEDDPDFGGDTNPGIAHDAIGAMGVAVFDAPSFLIQTTGFEDPKHGTFFRDGSGKVAPFPGKPTAKVWATFVVPKGVMPAAGFPVIVFQHGLGGQRGDALALANSFARRGWATVAIEPVLLSTRALDANARGDKKSDYLRKTSTYRGPDGFIDTAEDGSNGGSTDLFGALFRSAAMRDQFRQSALDHATLLHLLQSSPTLEGLSITGVTPKIDGAKTAYVGSSLGGILGTMLAGIDPGHRAFILNVPGGGIFTELAPNSPNIAGLLRGAAALFFGLGRAQTPPHHPLPNVLSHVIDGGDPIAFAPFVVATPNPPIKRNVLMIEVLRDEIVSNASTEALARAMGIPLVRPHGPTLATLSEVDGAAAHDVPTMGATAVMIQLFPAEHGYDLFHKSGKRVYSVEGPFYGDPSQDVFRKLATPVRFENPYLETQTAALDFIAEALDGRVPTLKWTKAPQPVKD
jgi:hypothetical protein